MKLRGRWRLAEVRKAQSAHLLQQAISRAASGETENSRPAKLSQRGRHCSRSMILEISRNILQRNFFVTFRHLNFSIEANELELPFLFDAVIFNRSLDS